MKHKNSVSDFTSERNVFLLNRFREQLASQSKISLSNAFEGAAAQPAPRFWVSEARAAAVIGKFLRGEDPTACMYDEKREMYREIWQRFLALRGENPDESIGKLVFTIVNSPAPRSYMSGARAKIVIYGQKRQERRAKALAAAERSTR